jgi:hypothetical protein
VGRTVAGDRECADGRGSRRLNGSRDGASRPPGVKLGRREMLDAQKLKRRLP